MDTTNPSGKETGTISPGFGAPTPTSNETGDSAAKSLMQTASQTAQKAVSDKAVSDTAEAIAPIAEAIRSTATTATWAVRQQATEFARDVGHELKQTAEDQKTRGVEAMQTFARAIKSAAAELEHQSPGVAQTVRDTAQKVESLSNNLGNRSVDELIRGTTDLARAQPMLFIGGAVALGFALARFLKSSAEQASAASQTPASPQPASPQTSPAPAITGSYGIE